MFGSQHNYIATAAKSDSEKAQWSDSDNKKKIDKVMNILKLIV